MTYFLESAGVLFLSVLAFMLWLTVRRPQDSRVRAITAMITAWTLGYPFSRAAGDGVWFLGLDPMQCQLVQYSALVIGTFCAVLFFVFSALDDKAATRHALLQTIPLAIAITVMAVSVWSLPDSLRVAAAQVPKSFGGGPVGVPGITFFYAAANSYLGYSFATMFVWTRRYARDAEPRLRRGLLIASIGLALLVYGDVTFVGGNLSRLTGTPFPRIVLQLGTVGVVVGLVLFVIGMAYPAGIMRVAAMRVWTRHLRSYRRLAPLWTVLNRQFPEDALSRVPVHPLRDVLSLRGVHRRYYRRVIECRDGLVRVSPYFAQEDDRPVADRLKDALRAQASGSSVAHQPVPVAIPDGDGLDADVRELEELSFALRTA